jgi:hypothetical protein
VLRTARAKAGRRPGRRIARGGLAAIAATAGAGAFAISATATDTQLLAAAHPVSQRPAVVREYWTPARMRAATPIEDRRASEPAATGVVVEPGGTPSYAAPAAAGVPDREIGLRSGSATSAAASRAASDVSEENDAYPRRVHGKVFLTLGEHDFLCSATVVDSASHTLVWTAGHCLHGADVGLGFATNWMFVPGYRQGETPFGAWTATELMTTDGWRDGADLRVDEGAALVARDEEGRGIQDVVGARGIAFNQPRDATFEAYGYPADDPNTPLFPPNFDGEHLFRCVSPRTASDAPPGAGPDTIGIDCDMTAGSSGGSWIIGDEFVNSVTSYGYTFDSGHLFGPYFGSTAKKLYEQASGPPLLCGGRAVTNLGGPGADSFSGTEAADAFSLERGPDQARGIDGPDRACGGGGGDGLRGGPGNDRLRGQGGADLLIGGPGRDICDGGPGHDAVRGCEVRRHIP